MSFDLFVLFENASQTTQQKWVNELEKIGIECIFPDGFKVGIDIEISVQCRLNPPLVQDKVNKGRRNKVNKGRR